MVSHNQGRATWTLPNRRNTGRSGPPWPASPPSSGRAITPNGPGRDVPAPSCGRPSGDAGFIGVNVPEEYGGGGGGPDRARPGLRGDRRRGHAAAPAARVGRDLGRDDRRVRHRRSSAGTWLPGLASGAVKVVFAITEPDAGSNTHRISTTARARRRRLGAERHQVLHLRGRRGAGADGGRADRRRTTRGGQLSLFIVPDRRARAWPKHLLPVDLAAAGPAVHPALRRRPGRPRRAGRRGREGLPAGVPRPEPRTDHRSRARRRDRPLRPGRRGATTPPTRKVWDEPIGAHQGVAHPLAKAKIETELAALMTRQGRLAARPRPARGRVRPTWPSTPPPRPRSPPSTRPSRRTAATAWPASTASCRYWGLARLLRIAPVNREMILNYVAQHSLGLPRSY